MTKRTPDPEFLGAISGRLKKAREILGKTQKEVAFEIGSGHTSWQAYEAGTKAPGSQVIFALSRLGINAHWLLTGEGEMLVGKKPMVSAEDWLLAAEIPAGQPLPSETPEEKTQLLVASTIVNTAIKKAELESPDVFLRVAMRNIAIAHNVAPDLLFELAAAIKQEIDRKVAEALAIASAKNDQEEPPKPQ